MYRLLIVDDEAIIVDGLVDLFSSLPDLELEIYKAYYAVDALELMRKDRIDIVLSDISMPGMTGLDIQKEIKIQWPRSKVIFLTGFNEFDYVQTAIRNGGIDYILKTEADETIIKAVKKAIDEIDKDILNEELVEKAKQNMLNALPILQKKYIMNLLEGIYNWHNINLQDEFSQLKIPLQAEKSSILMIARIDNLDLSLSMTEKMKIVYGIESIANKYMSQVVDSFSMVYESKKLVWIIQPNDEEKYYEVESWNRIIVFVQGTMESIQKKCKEVLDISTSFAASALQSSWRNIPESFYSLNLTLNKSAGVEEELLLVDYNTLKDNGYSSIKAEEEYFIRQKLQKTVLLETYIESGQKEEFENQLELIFENTESHAPMSFEFNTEIYYTIAMIFLSYINRLNLSEKLKPILDLNLLLKMEEHKSWEEIYVYFLNIANKVFELKKKEHASHNYRTIDFIKKHTEENIGGDLSLTRFSELLHFNPSYLSRMYKQYTGESISEHISEVKFNKAREMLKKSNMKINEIAIALGFETPSYFTRFFKKKTNLSPQEYRDFTG
ncbi:MAG TPA: response regulator [Ruminiclostridium sp.]